jgi:hypothetical protein
MSSKTFLDSASDSPCGCEPCDVDLAQSSWVTATEDPFYSGKQCKWHRVINGKRGTISPDVDGSIFVQIKRMDRKDFDVIPEAVGYLTASFAHDVQFTVSVSELNHWAKAIGAKRR